jgi:hypothetical protein
MKTLFDILVEAPPAQVTPCKIAMVEIAHGHWAAAALTMENVASETGSGEWMQDCMQMKDFCVLMDEVKYHGIEACAKVRELA